MNAILLVLREGVISIYIKIYETNFRPQYNLNDLCRRRITTIKITEIDCTGDININVGEWWEAQGLLCNVANELAALGSAVPQTQLLGLKPGCRFTMSYFKLLSSIKPFMAITNFQDVDACYSRPSFFCIKMNVHKAFHLCFFKHDANLN